MKLSLELIGVFDMFGIYLKGGSIGSKSGKDNILFIFETKEEAKERAKDWNKMLTPGEKSYYGMRYMVVTL
jgi:hypothetical protein